MAHSYICCNTYLCNVVCMSICKLIFIRDLHGFICLEKKRLSYGLPKQKVNLVQRYF